MQRKRAKASVGIFDGAIKAYGQAIQADSANLFAYSNIAYAYEEKGDMAKALEYLQKAVNINSDDAVAWYDLGDAYNKQGGKVKALEAFERSYKIAPNNYKACLSLALAHEDNGNLEKASGYYVKAMALTDDPKLKDAILRQISRAGTKT